MTSVYRLAKALWLQHGFDPDVAVSAAHCYIHGEFPTASYAQAMARMERVKHVPEVTEDEISRIEAAYRKVKVGY